MRILYLTRFLLCVLSITNSFGQKLQVQTFGNPEDKPLIFLHGGPGYNSVPFEITTAEALAKSEFYVISYDRRGEGRNENLKAAYTFQETFDDINTIYNTYNLDKATLIGHSFGGIIGTFYADKYPEKIEKLVLVGAPVSLQETLSNIITKSKEIYTVKNDQVNLGYISMLEKMDKTSLEYSSYSFIHAMSNNFYATKAPTEQAIDLYKLFQTNELLKNYGSKMGYAAPQGFWKNENYTTIDLTNTLTTFKNRGVQVSAIYGKEDGLYAVEQVKNLEALIGSKNVYYLDNCSHNVFIDQQDQFLNILK